MFPYDAMEPLLDAETMEIHHGQHHAAYIARLNELLRGRDSLSGRSLAEIVGDIRVVPQDIRQGVRNNRPVAHPTTASSGT